MILIVAFDFSRESQFFAQIIKHGVVHQLYQLTKVEEVSYSSKPALNI